MRNYLLASAALMVGCSSGGPRAISGQVSAGYALDNPAVIAQAVGGHVFVRPVLADGSFRLDVATPGTYRLTLANATRAGVYRGIVRLPWLVKGARLRWAQISGGSPILLGAVRAPATTSAGLSTMSVPPESDPAAESGSAEDSGTMENDEHDDALECDGSDAIDGDDDAQGDQVEAAADDQGDQEAETEIEDRCASTEVGSGPAATTSTGAGASGAACVVNADCAPGLACIASTCATLVL